MIKVHDNKKAIEKTEENICTGFSKEIYNYLLQIELTSLILIKLEVRRGGN
jgi:hypothetical protein